MRNLCVAILGAERVTFLTLVKMTSFGAVGCRGTKPDSGLPLVWLSSKTVRVVREGRIKRSLGLSSEVGAPPCRVAQVWFKISDQE